MANFQQINKWNANYQDLNRAALNYANAMGNMANAVSGFADNINAGLDKRLEYIQNENLKQRKNNTQEILNRLYQMSPQQLQQAVANGELSTEALRQQFGTNQGFKLGNAGFDESAINSAILQGPTNAYRNAMINDEAKLYSEEGQNAYNMMSDAQATGDPRIMAMVYQKVGHLLPTNMRMNIASHIGQGVNDQAISQLSSSMSNQAEANYDRLKDAQQRRNNWNQRVTLLSEVANRMNNYLATTPYATVDGKKVSVREAFKNMSENLNSDDVNIRKQHQEWFKGALSEMKNYVRAAYGSTHPAMADKINNIKTYDELEAFMNNEGAGIFDDKGNFLDPRYLVLNESYTKDMVNADEQYRGYMQGQIDNQSYPQQFSVNNNPQINNAITVNPDMDLTEEALQGMSPSQIQGKIFNLNKQLETNKDVLNNAHLFFGVNENGEITNEAMLQKITSGNLTPHEKELYNLLNWENSNKLRVKMLEDAYNGKTGNVTNALAYSQNNQTRNSPDVLIQRVKQSEQQPVTNESIYSNYITNPNIIEDNINMLGQNGIKILDDKGKPESNYNISKLFTDGNVHSLLNKIEQSNNPDSPTNNAIAQLRSNNSIAHIQLGIFSQSKNPNVKHLITGGSDVIDGYTSINMISPEHFDTKDLKNNQGESWKNGELLKAPINDAKLNRAFVKNLFESNGINISDVMSMTGFSELFTFIDAKQGKNFSNLFVKAVSDTQGVDTSGNYINREKTNYAMKVIKGIIASPDSALTSWGRANNKAEAINQFLTTLSNMSTSEFNEAKNEINKLNRLTTFSVMHKLPGLINNQYKGIYPDMGKFVDNAEKTGKQLMQGNQTYSQQDIENMRKNLRTITFSNQGQGGQFIPFNNSVNPTRLTPDDKLRLMI